MAPLTRFQLTRPVTRERFNLDDLGPQVSQEQRAERPRESLRKIQYSHVVERYGPLRSWFVVHCFDGCFLFPLPGGEGEGGLLARASGIVHEHVQRNKGQSVRCAVFGLTRSDVLATLHARSLHRHKGGSAD